MKLLELPDELIIAIDEYFDPKTRLLFGKVNKDIRSIIQSAMNERHESIYDVGLNNFIHVNGDIIKMTDFNDINGHGEVIYFEYNTSDKKRCGFLYDVFTYTPNVGVCNAYCINVVHAQITEIMNPECGLEDLKDIYYNRAHEILVFYYLCEKVSFIRDVNKVTLSKDGIYYSKDDKEFLLDTNKELRGISLDGPELINKCFYDKQSNVLMDIYRGKITCMIFATYAKIL